MSIRLKKNWLSPLSGALDRASPTVPRACFSLLIFPVSPGAWTDRSARVFQFGFQRDIFAGAAAAQTILFPDLCGGNVFDQAAIHLFGLGVAALHDEPFHVAVEQDAVVELLLDQIEEMRDGLRGCRRQQFNDDIPAFLDDHRDSGVPFGSRLLRDSRYTRRAEMRANRQEKHKRNRPQPSPSVC